MRLALLQQKWQVDSTTKDYFRKLSVRKQTLTTRQFTLSLSDKRLVNHGEHQKDALLIDERCIAPIG